MLIALRMVVHRCNLPRAWLADLVAAFVCDCRRPDPSQPSAGGGASDSWLKCLWEFLISNSVMRQCLTHELARNWCYTVLSTWTQRKNHFAQDLCPSILLWNPCVFQAWDIHSVLELPATDPVSFCLWGSQGSHLSSQESTVTSRKGSLFLF